MNEIYEKYRILLENVIKTLENFESINEIFDTTSFKELYIYTPITYSHYRKALQNLINKCGVDSNYDYYKDNDYHQLKDYLDTISRDYLMFFNNLSQFGSFSRLVYFYVLLLLFLSYGYYAIRFIDANLDVGLRDFNYELTMDKSFNPFWFRGVSNSNFDLIPSMYRGIIEDYVHIDDDYVNDRYIKTNLVDFYKRRIHDNYSNDEFFAYMQHSLSFSPFIDFSYDINVAGSFATHYGNINDYENIDSAIFLLIREEHKGDSTSDRNIEFFKNKLKFDSLVFNKELYKCTIDDLTVKYRTITNEYNDRMRYQKGLFIDIRKAVIVNNKLLFPSSGTSLFKLIIPTEKNDSKFNKNMVHKYLMEKHPEYEERFLMDPYLWFRLKH